MAGDALFLYDLSSPYAYLAAARIDSLIPGAEWRPICFGALIEQIGKMPWSLKEGREQEMEAISQRAVGRGLPPVRWPRGWPRETYSVRPIRAALVADGHGRQREFALAAFSLAFADGRVLGEDDALRDASVAAGLDPDEVLAGIERPDVKRRLRESTDEAIALGVTGVPTVLTGGGLHHGDDRLEEAAAAAR